MYLIKFKDRAEKTFQKLELLDRKMYNRCCLALMRLSRDPFVGKKLDGEYKGYWSIRVWPHRIVYQIFKNELIVYVVKIKHRKDVYR